MRKGARKREGRERDEREIGRPKTSCKLENIKQVRKNIKEDQKHQFVNLQQLEISNFELNRERICCLSFQNEIGVRNFISKRRYD